LCPKQNSLKKYKEPFILIDEYNKEYILTFDCISCNMKIISK